jgi:hypothetical protein
MDDSGEYEEAPSKFLLGCRIFLLPVWRIPNKSDKKHSLVLEKQKRIFGKT